MGYRTYIASMPKKEYDKIKSMTCDELVNFYQIETNEGESWYKGVYEYGERLYEFGKYTDFDQPKDSLNPFFENKEYFRVDLEWWDGVCFDNMDERNIPLYFCEINKPVIV